MTNLFDIQKKIFLDKIKFLNDELKILIMDNSAHLVMSILFSKKEMNDINFFQFSNIDQNINIDPNAKLVFLLESTKENFDKIKIKLSNKLKIQCYIYFTEKLSMENLKLTSILCCPNVKVIDELLLNYNVIHKYGFHLNTENLTPSEDDKVNIVNKLFNVMHNLEYMPEIIHTDNSTLCTEIYNLLKKKISNNQVHFKENHKNLLIILDRKNDSITPIITSWKYISMIHNIMNVTNNKTNDGTIIDLYRDEFLDEHCFDNYGQICEKIRDNTEKLILMRAVINGKKISDELKELPQLLSSYSSLSDIVNIHNKLMGQIVKEVRNNNLMNISEIEQSLTNKKTIINKKLIDEIIAVIENKTVSDHHKLKLILIYVLGSNDQKINAKLFGKLFDNVIDKSLVNIVDGVMAYANYDSKTPDKFRNLLNYIISKMVVKNEHVLMKYVPEIKYIADKLICNKIEINRSVLNFNVNRYENIVFYIVGGITYDELSVINDLNNSTKFKFFIGGDNVLNSTKFIKLIDKSFCKYAP